MRRYCLALDLKDNSELIAEYEYWHRAENGWPEVRKAYWMQG
jgi:L-rhamnose mutarotase